MICFSVKIADVVFGICANYPETKAFFAHFSSEEQEEHQITVSAEDIAFFRRQFPQCVRLAKCFNNHCNAEMVSEWIWTTQNEMQWAYEQQFPADGAKKATAE